MQNPDSADSPAEFRLGQRVHSLGDPRRMGTVKYVGPVQGYSGTWVGVDWDNGDAKHDGALDGRPLFPGARRQIWVVRSPSQSIGWDFAAPSATSPVPIHYLQGRGRHDPIFILFGVSYYVAEEMYVLSASNRRVSVQLVGKEQIEDKLSRFEELTAASLSYLGVSSIGAPFEICSVVPSRSKGARFDWQSAFRMEMGGQ
ncbi:Tubulin-folding cofactor E [Vitis vinifera]|uniref:Tubulin-folding cofactor E n=1 Tax=Vitis vinifera TaxID=29760 RepID=A0A438DCL5_VITVI|nr:Tubulin-folding cofactor E [Vitis vinifera]